MDAPLGDYTIFVKTLTGRVIQLEVSAADTVADLKLKIQDKTDIAPAAQRYIFQAKQLQDDQTLGQCGVRKEAIVNLIVRQDLAPAAPPPPKVRPAPGQGDPVNEHETRSGGLFSRKKKEKQEPAGQRHMPPQAWMVQPMGRLDSLLAGLVTLLSVIWSLIAFPFRFVNRVVIVPLVRELTRLISFLIIRPLRFLVVRPIRYLFTNILPPVWHRALLPLLRFIFSTTPRFVQRMLTSAARAINTYVIRPLATPVRALWNHVLYPVLRFVYNIMPSYIGRAGTFVYHRLLRPIKHYLSVVLRALFISTPRFVWRTTLEPALRFIGNTFRVIHTRLFAPLGRVVTTVVQRTMTVLRGVCVALRETLIWIVDRGLPALYRHTLRPLYRHLIYPFLRFVFVTIPNAITDGISATGRFIRDRILYTLCTTLIFFSSSLVCI